MAKWPTGDAFAQMSSKEQQAVRDRSARAVEDARAAVQAKEAELRGKGATWQEICKDLRS